MLLTVVKVISDVVDCCCVAELQPGGEAAEQGLHQLQPQPGFRHRVYKLPLYLQCMYCNFCTTAIFTPRSDMHFCADALLHYPVLHLQTIYHLQYICIPKKDLAKPHV
jgi:hypothetical protein